MAFVSLLLYVSFIYIRPQEWVKAFYGFPLLGITAVVAMVSTYLSLQSTGKKYVYAPQNKFIIGFMIALLLSHLSHFYFGGAQLAFEDFSKIVIIYFLMINVIDNIKKFEITVAMFILLTIVLAIQGISQFKTGIGWAGQPPFVIGETVRITWVGIFSDPNDLALAFVIIVPFLLCWLFGKGFGLKLLAIVSLPILFYAIYLTNSRGGMLALLAVLMVSFLRYAKKKKFLFLGVFGCIAILVVAMKFGPSRMSNISADEASAYGRIEAWYAGIQMLKSSPIFGVGYNMFHEHHMRTAHNSMILCIAETGLLGYYFWVGLFYFCIRDLKKIQKTFQKVKEKAEITSYALALETSIIGFIAAAFFLSRTYIILPYLLIALSVSFNYIASKETQSLNSAIRSADYKNIALIVLGSFIMTYGVMKMSL